MMMMMNRLAVDMVSEIGRRISSETDDTRETMVSVPTFFCNTPKRNAVSCFILHRALPCSNFCQLRSATVGVAAVTHFAYNILAQWRFQPRAGGHRPPNLPHPQIFNWFY